MGEKRRRWENQKTKASTGVNGPYCNTIGINYLWVLLQTLYTFLLHAITFPNWDKFWYYFQNRVQFHDKLNAGLIFSVNLRYWRIQKDFEKDCCQNKMNWNYSIFGRNFHEFYTFLLTSWPPSIWATYYTFYHWLINMLLENGLIFFNGSSAWCFRKVG